MVHVNYTERSVEDSGFRAEGNLHDSTEFSGLQRDLRHADELHNNNGGEQYDGWIFWDVRDRYDGGSGHRFWNGLVLPSLLLLGSGHDVSLLLSVARHVW